LVNEGDSRHSPARFAKGGGKKFFKKKKRGVVEDNTLLLGGGGGPKEKGEKAGELLSTGTGEEGKKPDWEGAGKNQPGGKEKSRWGAVQRRGARIWANSPNR